MIDDLVMVIATSVILNFYVLGSSLSPRIFGNKQALENIFWGIYQHYRYCLKPG